MMPSPHAQEDQYAMPNTLHTLDGERGAPQVKSLTYTLPRTWISFFVFMLFLLVLAIVHYSYKKQVTVPSQRAQKAQSGTLQSVIPSRSFDKVPPAVTAPLSMPPASAVMPTKQSDLGVSNTLPGPQRVFPFPLQIPIRPTPAFFSKEKNTEKKRPSLDKSHSALMVSKDMPPVNLPTGAIDSLYLNRAEDKASLAQVMSAMNSMDRTQASEDSPAQAEGKHRSLGHLLQPTPTAMQRARPLGDRNFIVPKGTFINCVLQTKLDTSVAGMTRCGVSHHVYSDNGKVVLIERGSTISGEYQTGTDQGSKRVFILWSRLKTPSGMVVDLDSPATDALGATGVQGRVDTHFWARFGGAIAISFIGEVGKAMVALANETKQNGPAIHLDETNQSGQEMAAQALKHTINIAPTLYKNQGESIGVYLARDLDFSGVYDVFIE